MQTVVLLSSSDINATKVMIAAQAFVSLGLKDVGYEYVNIDVSLLPHSKVRG
jgi:alpha-galactosidase